MPPNGFNETHEGIRDKGEKRKIVVARFVPDTSRRRQLTGSGSGSGSGSAAAAGGSTFSQDDLDALIDDWGSWDYEKEGRDFDSGRWKFEDDSNLSKIENSKFN